MPDEIAELLASFRRHNPDFEHRLFSEEQTVHFIGEHFGSREVEAFRGCAVSSMQSDYFRYCVVLALGGIYVDADYRCIKPLRPLLDGCEEGEIFLSPTVHDLNGRQTQRVWSALFAFREPGHPFLELALEIATANMEARIAEQVWPVGEKVIESIWLTVGPGIFTLMRFIRDWGSLDAFVEGVAGSPIEPFADLYCETIGSYDRIVEAFRGVRVSPNESMFNWIASPDPPPQYKQGDAYWRNFSSAIFR